jgi:pseudaminic acid cytidylyltransferase
MHLAIIPARGGSKRIPRKNIKQFAGIPMIAHAIIVAKASGLFDHVVVSTDDKEVAEIARIWGVETPFGRPATLADDHTPPVPVIAHAVIACQDVGWKADYVCCIYPCSPLIETDDLVSSLKIAKAEGAEFIYPVTEYPHPIQRAMRQLSSGAMKFLSSESELIRTQDLEKNYHDAGQFYWGKANAWLEHKNMHSDGLGYPIPSWRVVDIDTEDDWRRADLVLNLIKQHTLSTAI